jgi:DNA invertase Pin-like site-specific DNA recombinase
MLVPLCGVKLTVWRLDRLGRSLKHLIETVTALQQQQIAFTGTCRPRVVLVSDFASSITFGDASSG